MNGANVQNIGVLIVALLVIGFIGAFALIYPNTPSGELALGALLPIAGGIGTYFFHTASQGFLGAQLQAQRAGFVAAITSPSSGVTLPRNSMPTSAPLSEPTSPIIPTPPNS
jgi:hypothetical protein